MRVVLYARVSSEKAAKENKKSSPFPKIFSFWVDAGGFHCYSRKEERESFIFPAFSLVRETQKDFEGV